MTTTIKGSHHSDAPAAMPRGLVVMIGYCVILATLVMTIPLKLLGQIGAEFGATGGLLNWVVIIGSLSGAIGTALLPPVASLFGQRRTTVVTMGLLTFGSILGAVAPNMTVLLVGRFIGGFTLGAIALALAIARANLSGRTLTVVLSWIAAAEGVAAGLSFAVGGLLTDTVQVDWRAVFGVLAVLGTNGIAGPLATSTGLVTRRSEGSVLSHKQSSRQAVVTMFSRAVERSRWGGWSSWNAEWATRGGGPF